MSRGKAPAAPAVRAGAKRAAPEGHAPAPTPASGGAGNQAMLAALRDGGGGAPLDASTRRRAEARLGVPLDDVRLHRGAPAEGMARSLGARAFAAGPNVALGRSAGRASLAHELVHVAQAKRRGAAASGHGPPVLAEATPAETEARSLAPGLLSGEGPLPVRAAPGALIQRDPAPDAPAEPAAGEVPPEWSFDPYAEEVVGLGNTALVLRTLQAREWLSQHVMLELDHEAYRILLDRLDMERDWRINLGHLWLDDIDVRQSQLLYRLMPGLGGAIDLVEVTNFALIDDGGRDLEGQPIMSARQFQAYKARNGIGEMPLETYLQRLQQPGEPEAPAGGGAMGLGSTAAAAASQTSPRARMLRTAFGNQSPADRQGKLAEVFFGTSRAAGYGFGAQDLNLRSTSTPLVDFRLFFGDRPELSVKSRMLDTEGSRSGNRFDAYSNYLEGLSRNLDVAPGARTPEGLPPGARSFELYMNEAAAGRGAAQVRADLGLVVNADDLADFRAFVAEPMAREPKPGGAPSEEPNYRRAEMSRIYDGVLRDAPIEVGDGGAPLRTVAELDTALESGRIGVMQHDAYLRAVGTQAAAQVFANPDFGAAQSRVFQDAFMGMHESLRPGPLETPDRWTAARRADTARSQSASRIEQFDAALRVQAEMLAGGGDRLHVAPGDVAAYQGLLRDTHGREATAGGGQSRRFNYEREAVKQVYDAVLARDPAVSASGESFGSMEALKQALTDRRLSPQEHTQLTARVGQAAAAMVVPDDLPDSPEAQARRQAREVHRARLAEANAFIRRNASAEYMSALAHGGGMRGDLRAARSFGARGAGLGGAASYAFAAREHGWDSPEARNAALLGTAQGGISTAAETVAASRASQYLLREGLEVSAAKALALRAGARGIPLLGDVGLETYNILTEDRPHSAGEVGYRMGRTLVIGGTSIWAAGAAGAAIGTLIPIPGVGTAVGFIVGIGVGVALNYLLPSWDDVSKLFDSEPQVNYSHHVYSESQFRRMKAEGRCMPSHHQTFEVVPDHQYMGEFMPPLRGAPGPLWEAAQREATGGAPLTMPGTMRLMNPALTVEEERQLRAWLEAEPGPQGAR